MFFKSRDQRRPPAAVALQQPVCPPQVVLLIPCEEARELGLDHGHMLADQRGLAGLADRADRRVVEDLGRPVRLLLQAVLGVLEVVCTVQRGQRLCTVGLVESARAVQKVVQEETLVQLQRRSRAAIRLVHAHKRKERVAHHPQLVAKRLAAILLDLCKDDCNQGGPEPRQELVAPDGHGGVDERLDCIDAVGLWQVLVEVAEGVVDVCRAPHIDRKAVTILPEEGTASHLLELLADGADMRTQKFQHSKMQGHGERLRQGCAEHIHVLEQKVPFHLGQFPLGVGAEQLRDGCQHGRRLPHKVDPLRLQRHHCIQAN
eukprot:m.119955 g.119955  ORF g.119955 m.119955 type:complete len:317 (-) comp9265_c1_seq1:1117-2067(-)